MTIERKKGQSKLEEKLEEYKDSGTRHIILTPEEAKNVLFEALLSAHRASVSRPNSTVEVLAQIAGAEGERFDFTKAQDKFEHEQAEQERQAQEREIAVLMRPPTPPVREI